MLFDLNDVEISHEFEILMSEDPTHETLQEEPSVKYRYAYQHSRTPPALVINQDQQWQGQLLVGGIENRLSVE